MNMQPNLQVFQYENHLIIDETDYGLMFMLSGALHSHEP